MASGLVSEPLYLSLNFLEDAQRERHHPRLVVLARVPTGGNRERR